MARDQGPMTDADDLGDKPGDYRSERYFRDRGADADEAVPDGGE